VTPGAVVLASTPQHICETVRFAAQRGLRVTVQATGHGALGVTPETILVSTAVMSGVVIDAPNRTARVGAGAQLAAGARRRTWVWSGS
jgi:FAD/FMN-containing dehydrogenase